MAKQIEGGNPDSGNETCCICLENFTQGGISTVTHCNHQYHLQCILEWCQRSPNCPTCRQKVSLKETESQELLEAVEYERKMKAEELKKATTLITPAELNSSMTTEEVQERLRQYMANMGRRYQFSANEDQSSSSSSLQTRSHVVVYSTSQRGPGQSVRVVSTKTHVYTSRNSNGESSAGGQGKSSGKSDFQAFSDSLTSFQVITTSPRQISRPENNRRFVPRTRRFLAVLEGKQRAGSIKDFGKIQREKNNNKNVIFFHDDDFLYPFHLYYVESLNSTSTDFIT